MTSALDYGSIMNTAMRFFVRKVLEKVVSDGLPDKHHFFIKIDTTHSKLEMASWLREKYPSDITIVMQHWFENLNVKQNGFEVTLNFGDVPEPFYIPYDAILTFVDPSVEFGVKFEQMNSENETNELTEALQNITEPSEKKVSLRDSNTTKSTNTKEVDGTEAEIVQLDRFRKP